MAVQVGNEAEIFGAGKPTVGQYTLEDKVVVNALLHQPAEIFLLADKENPFGFARFRIGGLLVFVNEAKRHW